MSYNNVTSCGRDAGIFFQLFDTILPLFDSPALCIQMKPSDSSENQMEAEVIFAFLSERNVTRDLLTSHNNPVFYPAYWCCLPPGGRMPEVTHSKQTPQTQILPTMIQFGCPANLPDDLEIFIL